MHTSLHDSADGRPPALIPDAPPSDTGAGAAAAAASRAAGSSDVFTSASAARVEELQRTLEVLYRDIIFPFYEPVERLRVTNNRAIRVQDVVDAIAAESRSTLSRPPSVGEGGSGSMSPSRG